MYIKGIFSFCGRFVICDILEGLARRGKGGRKERNDKFISVWACTSADLIDLSNVSDE